MHTYVDKQFCWMDECMGGWMNGWRDGWLGEQIFSYGLMDVWWVGGLMDELGIDGWMDKLMGGRMKGWMDG